LGTITAIGVTVSVKYPSGCGSRRGKKSDICQSDSYQ
jgi:hypothetical protein